MRDIEDFQKYYSNTYIRIVQDGITRPFFCREVLIDDEMVQGSVLTNGNWIPYQAPFGDVTFDLDIPDTGFITIMDPVHLRDTAVYVSLMPERQWKKGLSNKIITYDPAHPQSISSRIDLNKANVIEQIFNPRYYPFEAFLANTDKYISMPLSRNLAIGVNNIKNVWPAIITYKTIAVGYLDEDSNTAYLTRGNRHLLNYVSKHIPCEVE